MIKQFYRIVFLAVLTATSALLANAQTVSGSIGNGTVTRGVAARATVTLSLPGGLHVNSSRPGSEYAIPTTIRARARGLKVGAVVYPRGKNQKFEFSENTINVYDGRTSFWFPVTVPANYAGDSIAVNVSVRYQACTNEVCYPPKTTAVILRAKVK